MCIYLPDKKLIKLLFILNVVSYVSEHVHNIAKTFWQ